MTSFNPLVMSGQALGFLAERHLATLSTVRPDGTVHVVPVGFSFDPTDATVRVICSEGSRKVKNIERGSRATVCQVDGARWLSLEGPASVLRDSDDVDDAVRRYADRYQQPRVNPNRVGIRIVVDRVIGSSSFEPAG